MKRLFYSALMAVLMFTIGCGDSFYEVYNDLTGPVESVAIPKTLSIVVNTTEKIEASVYPSMTKNKNVTWSSADPLIASVDEAGVVTGYMKGGEYLSTTITVTTEDGGFTAQCTVTVVPAPIPIESITLPATFSVENGQQQQLTAVYLPADATNAEMTWQSSDSSVASVDSAGLVTGVKNGSARITVTSVKWEKSASCEITVVNPVLATDLTLNYSNHNTTKVETIQLVATLSPTDTTMTTIDWGSSNTAVATVNSSGLVSVIGAGSAVITARTMDGSNKIKYFNVTATGYSVIYDGNHKTAGTIPVDSQTYLEGETFTTKTKGTTLAYYDRTFSGWSTVEDGGTLYAEGAVVAMGPDNIILHAKWQAFALRSTGPAGGWIFYDKGGYSDGWRYLETAPSDIGIDQAWCTGDSVNFATVLYPLLGTVIGTGSANTNNIADTSNVGTTVAGSCRNLIVGIYDDWFMPSRDELKKMYDNLLPIPVGFYTGVSPHKYYLSSSILDGWVTCVDFNNGNIYESSTGNGVNNNTSVMTRPIRDF